MIPVAYKTALLQAAIGVSATVLFWVWNSAAGMSALMALACVLIPTAYYAWLQQRTLVATRILVHGVLKMVLTVTLMAVCIIKFGIEPLGFFATFAAMQLSYIFSQTKSTEDIQVKG